MTFQRESEMLQPVLKWLEAQELLIKKEFPTPWGICDAVGVSLNGEKAQKRIGYGQRDSLGRISAIALLDCIPDEKEGRSVTIGSLARKFEDFLRRGEILAEIERLRKKRFIKSTRLNHFQKLNGWMPLHDRIVTVEMKLNRIEEALFQARNNRSFATESYVALPLVIAERLRRSRRVTRFEEAGIGILAVNPESVQVLLSSSVSPSSPNKLVQAQLVDRFWSAYQRQLSINC